MQPSGLERKGNRQGAGWLFVVCGCGRDGGHRRGRQFIGKIIIPYLSECLEPQDSTVSHGVSPVRLYALSNGELSVSALLKDPSKDSALSE